MLYLGLYTGEFPACFYTVSGFKVHFSRLLRYFSSFRKFSAPILNPNICFVRIFPLTGIVSIWYLLRRMEGTVSTPFLTRERNSNCHVLRNRWDRTSNTSESTISSSVMLNSSLRISAPTQMFFTVGKSPQDIVKSNLLAVVCFKRHMR